MELLTIDQVEVTIDTEYNEDFSGAYEALQEGFNHEYPIVLDQDGVILDGNHRYLLFESEGRIDDLVFCVVGFEEFNAAYAESIERGEVELFEEDNEYFYSIIRKIAEWKQTKF